jgi:hypothetical protein
MPLDELVAHGFLSFAGKQPGWPHGAATGVAMNDA